LSNIPRTSQLDLWCGEHGRDYITRNEADRSTIARLTPMWARMLERAWPAPETILEVGANIGLNLRAIRPLTNAKLHAVEPNALARTRLVDDGVLAPDEVGEGIASQIPFGDGTMDLVFTSGVLIHIHPNQLLDSYRDMFRVSRRFVLSVEYFSAQPREVNYRGREGQLFLRDYGGFWMEHFPSLRLRDYGFFWAGAGAVDNLTWWLFEKPNS
jgi:pseudaminic acid biosynthesis-associated methylase